MKPIPSLSTIQRWMQSVIEHPGTNIEAWNSEQAQKEIPFDEAVMGIRPSPSLSPMERIGIYRQMFFLRMTESMAIDYPGVKHTLGEEEFDRLIMEEYLRKHPSNSHTLNHLGRHFPRFIRDSSLKERSFLGELAQLELSVTEVMDAEESPLLTPEAIAAVPTDEWANVRLLPVAALQLHEFDHTVCEYLSAVNESEEPDPVKVERTFAAVHRTEYRTYWHVLSRQQHTLLNALITGSTIGEAVSLMEEQFPGMEEDLQKEVFQWFNEWIRDGYFSGVTKNEHDVSL